MTKLALILKMVASSARLGQDRAAGSGLVSSVELSSRETDIRGLQ